METSVAATNYPIPRDIPLPLPGVEADFAFMLIVTFVAHIFFVNLMVAGTWLTWFYEWRGWRSGNQDYDRLAKEIAATVTVNKSLAVVLGVGPLLLINVLYTLHFYTANALTGHAWIAIIPLVVTAFLLLYLHKYTWQALEYRKGLHLAILAGAGLLFLFIPLIFLANINLMLFPEKWVDVRGFLSTLTLPNVLPRYLHFLLASFGVTGLFLAFYFGRSHFQADEKFESFGRPELVKRFYRLTFDASALQFVAGPLVLFTLPTRGIDVMMVANILAGATCALAALALLWREIRPSTRRPGRWFWPIATLLSGTVLFMALGRHLYRENSLREHRALIAERTQEYMDAAAYAEATFDDPSRHWSPEQRLFMIRCAACHLSKGNTSAPPLAEIATLYAGKPEKIVEWALAPGKRRANYPQMPSMRHVPEADLYQIAEYMLQSGNPAEPEAAEAPAAD